MPFKLQQLTTSRQECSSTRVPGPRATTCSAPPVLGGQVLRCMLCVVGGCLAYMRHKQECDDPQQTFNPVIGVVYAALRLALDLASE